MGSELRARGREARAEVAKVPRAPAGSPPFAKLLVLVFGDSVVNTWVADMLLQMCADRLGSVMGQGMSRFLRPSVHKWLHD